MYLNRTQADGLGMKCRVSLSAVIYEDTSGIFTQPVVNAVGFEGFSLKCEFAIDSWTQAGITTGFENPRWVVTSLYDESVITTIPGMDVELDIRVHEVGLKELFDWDFEMDQGEPVFRGGFKANLPHTLGTLSYTWEDECVGEVNGVTYTVGGYSSDTQNIALYISSVGGMYIYGQGTYTVGGALSGRACICADADFSADYTYRADDPDGRWVEMVSHGNSITMEGADNALGSFRIMSRIFDFPATYKYNVSERSGLDVSALDFADRNGNTWTGASSPAFEYEGVQTVRPAGAFGNPGHTETATPPLVSGEWELNDPAPNYIGDVSCTNPEDLNPYVITEYDPDTEITKTYKPNAVHMWIPLGDDGDLSGIFTPVTSSVDVDAFSSGWTASGGTLSGHTLTVTGDGVSVTKTFQRGLYNGEEDPDSELTAAELIPHFPIGNKVRLKGVFPTQALTLQFEAKGKKYTYKPVSASGTELVYDLTRPVGIQQRYFDREDTYYDIHRVEQYEDKGEATYIDEEAQLEQLQGPSLFSTVTIKGFVAGQTYTLTKIVSEPSPYWYFCCGFEFKYPSECGESGGDDSRRTLSRNRYAVLMAGGRFVEIPCNLETVTSQGITIWQFPGISEITGSAPDRTMFPRDDYAAIEFVTDSPAGGALPPVSDLVTDQGKIGWINGDEVRFWCDRLNLEYRYNTDFHEIECFIDLGGCWQGFVNDSNDTLVIGTDSATSPDQYLTEGQVPDVNITLTRHGLTDLSETVTEVIPGFLYRLATRILAGNTGYILRNSAGKILRSSAGKILRGNYGEE